MQSTALDIDRANQEYLEGLLSFLPTASYKQTLKAYQAVTTDSNIDYSVVSGLAENDRYFLLTNILNLGAYASRIYHPWVFERCRQVEAEPDHCLDLWAREHWKSTIITFGGGLQEIIKSHGELTIGIFSHNSKHSRDRFINRFKHEMEQNPKLHKLWPDIFYQDPKKESPVWSRDAGLIVKRRGNPAEPTLSGWGLVDGQPTGSHFGLIIYDDVVTEKSVTTPEMIIKTTEMWELSTFMTQDQVDVLPRIWYIGTRYNYADTYQVMLDRKVAKPRIFPATEDGTPDGNPVFLTQLQWEDKKQKTSGYTLACHCAGTKILMSDWTYKNIEDVEIGEEVVGFKIGEAKGQKTQLIKTKVLAKNNRKALARAYYLKSGAIVCCTPDHKWWAKRGNKDAHKQYSELGDLGYHNLKSLYKIANIIEPDRNPQWQYLAGMLDGEGTFSGNRITITQSKRINPEVYDRIHSVLKGLKIDCSMYHRKGFTKHGKTSQDSSIFSINGGRDERHRILINANPAKKQKIIDSLFCKLGGKSTTIKDDVEDYHDLGFQPVYNIQTESGNYIANGYGSKNCQMLQNPMAGDQQEFKPEWIRRYEIRPEMLNVGLLVDPASSKKKASCDTAMAVLGISAGHNKLLLDGAYHKMNLKERWEMLKRLYFKWLRAPGIQCVTVGYEKYGLQSDIEHFEQMMLIEKCQFPIQEVSWPREREQGAKDDRIRRLIPDHHNWRFFYPYDGKELTSIQQKAIADGKAYLLAKPIKRKDENGRLYDVFEKFYRNEYLFFPATTKKDFGDAMSRIYDIDLNPPIIIQDKSLYPDWMAE